MKKTKFFMLLLFSVTFWTAYSQCVPPFEAGNWTNIDPNTGGITHLSINIRCNDQRLCGIDENGNVHCQPPKPPYFIQMWGACFPSDCNWGTADGNTYYSSDGTKWIYFYYDQGFAKRYVYIKPSSLYPGRLFMWMYTDFVSPSRADYIMRNWFKK